MHLSTAHKFDEITEYKSQVLQCLSDYNSWRKFRKHLISYHKFPANSVFVFKVLKKVIELTYDRQIQTLKMLIFLQNFFRIYRSQKNLLM